MITNTPWIELSFGRHKGKTLPQVIFSDPDWFFWAIENQVFQKRGGELAAQARSLDTKARNIKIPQSGDDLLVAEYLIHQPTMKFGDMKLVPKRQSLHQGGSPAFRKDRIDLSTPRSISEYDKTGCKLLLTAVRFHLFGDSSARITRKRAEAFFENADNFI